MGGEIISLNHVGITNSNETQALSFYRDILGFVHTRDFIVAPGLSKQIFSLAEEVRVLVFERGALKIEVFISSGFAPPPHTLSHIGLTVHGLEEFISFVSAKGVTVITGRHGEKTVSFIKDFAGNLIEIKEG